MSRRPYASVFYGLCWAEGAGVKIDESDEDALAERYATLALGFGPKPPRRYGDGTLVSDVTNVIDAQMKQKRCGYASEHEEWVARAAAAYEALGVSLEAHDDDDVLSIFVTASVTLTSEGGCARLALPSEGWPGGRDQVRRYCDALRLPFDEGKLGWWLTLSRS